MKEKFTDIMNMLSYTNIVNASFILLAAGLTLFHIFTATFGMFQSYLQMTIHLSFILFLVFISALKKENQDTAKQYLIIFWIILVSVSIGYIFFNFEYISVERYPFLYDLTKIEIIFAVIFVIVLLEAARRTVGLILPGICVLLMLYGLFGYYAPGILKHSGKTIHTILDLAYLSTNGTFGLPLYVSASYLVLFVIFGAVLKESGLGDFLMDVAKCLGGKKPGGPAKIAVLASAGMGSISGSPVANVMTTGTLTIPLMVKVGYKPYTAGAIEAVASTGGMITPPIMGILALLMSEFTGIPYITICKYALLPAILFYFGVFMYVHFEAKRLNLKGLSQSDIPDLKNTLKNGMHLLLPIIVLMYLLLKQYTPMYAVVYSIYSCIIVSFFRKKTRLKLRGIINIFQAGAEASLMLGIACAVAGLIGGIINHTGVALKLSGSIVDLVGGISMLLLLMTAGITVIMGTGLPSTVCYIVLLPLVIPALKAIGFSEVASHFFVVYWAALSFITPPVGLAFYAASAISNASVMKTGIYCVRVGAVAFVVPFLFAYCPSLLFIGTPSLIILTFISSIIGVFFLSIGFTGFWLEKLYLHERIICLGCSLMLIKPGLYTDIIGGIAITIVIICQIYRRRNRGKSKVVFSENRELL
ncbi:conserved membrane hypothetical protein [uncultured Desulfatiglans sp.]|uniref:TRAP C4-dicarboxylate transport system permease DctM subunit domain-containing protein n=1 Tax=Uncultured Desulfatiglans sp. TaxID=1748965 RepID=A0A653AAB1_UNCDX|nr:conserved membrane hypothetical protein [uncultured Desulfatiglans sp.]